MKLLTKEVAYDKTIGLAANLTGEYTKPVTFHCFWKGKALNQAHLYSIKSCHYFNVYKRNHKIILWLEDNSPNKYNKEIEKYAEIKHFSLKDEAKDTFLENYDPGFSASLLLRGLRKVPFAVQIRRLLVRFRLFLPKKL